MSILVTLMDDENRGKSYRLHDFFDNEWVIVTSNEKRDISL